jgi:hypothetical protein
MRNTSLHLTMPQLTPNELMIHSLSTCKMPKGIVKNWGVDVVQKAPNGSVIHGPDGRPLKAKVQMRDG